jgi:hypothetical protein
MCNDGTGGFESLGGHKGAWMAQVDKSGTFDTCIESGIRIFDTSVTGDGGDAVLTVFGATKLGTRHQLHPSPPCGSKSEHSDPWLDLFEPVCKIGGDNNEFYQGRDKIFLDSTIKEMIQYTNESYLSAAQLNTIAGSTEDHYFKGWAAPSEGNAILAGDDACDSHLCNSPEKNERDAQKVIRFTRRMQFFAQSQRDLGGDNNFVFSKLPPWFQSQNNNIDRDKCAYPEPFPPGAPVDKYWDMRLDRISSNAGDQQGPEVEVYDVRVYFQYFQASKMLDIDGRKRGVLSYKPKIHDSDDYWPEYIGIQAVPDSDDDFDCRTSRNMGVNYWASVGAVAGAVIGSAIMPGVGTSLGAAVGASIGGIDNAINDGGFMEEEPWVTFGIDDDAFSKEDRDKLKHAYDVSRFGIKIKKDDGSDCDENREDCVGCCEIEKNGEEQCAGCDPGVKYKHSSEDGCCTRFKDCSNCKKGKEADELGWYTELKGSKPEFKKPIDKFDGCKVPGTTFLRNVDNGGASPQYFHDFDLPNIVISKISFVDWDWEPGGDDLYECNVEGLPNLKDEWAYDEEGSRFKWVHCLAEETTSNAQHDDGTDLWFKLMRDEWYI